LAFIITPLSNAHDRKSFDCGNDALNQYLQCYANQDVRRRVTRIFVASPSDAQRQIVGYYALSAGSLEASDLPMELRRRLPKYPVPVVLLGRLAVNLSQQRKGLGALLLADALKRIAQISHVMAVYAVIVDALDMRAAQYYQQFGFSPLPSQPLKLFLPVDSITDLFD
jgi:predicted N-acetyltransferase YhbS